jgi:hypothetical protein
MMYITASTFRYRHLSPQYRSSSSTKLIFTAPNVANATHEGCEERKAVAAKPRGPIIMLKMRIVIG